MYVCISIYIYMYPYDISDDEGIHFYPDSSKYIGQRRAQRPH